MKMCADDADDVFATQCIASALVVADEDTKENGEAPAAPTTTPAGFEMKGSNPLFEDSIDASMDVDA